MASLELYKIFVEVANEKNITRASEKLHISQPAVTRHIKNLENDLNVVLFKRTNGMELTEAGEKLYTQVSTAIEKLVEIDRKYCLSNEILLATYGTMLSKVLSGAIAEFYSENKNAKIITITDNSKVLNNPLQCGDIDIAVLKRFEESEYDCNKYKYIKLENIEFYMIANNKSKLCQKKKIKIEDFKDKIIYIPRGDNNSTNTFKKLIEKFNLNSEVKRIDSVSMSQIVQEYDNCVGIANSMYLHKEIEQGVFSILDTDFKIPPTEMGIYYRKDNSSAELKNLIKTIRKYWKKIDEKESKIL
ncbi:MAG: LysR family transcriptional regulator [Clostridia bacterium]|nr:LysR family transcriptional regulator [Clostridia bacterium]